jgi:hypothetical protein
MNAELKCLDGSILSVTPENMVTHDAILELQTRMLPHAIAMPVAEHHFAPGIYMRDFTLPAGQAVVGKTHRHDHMLVVMEGLAVIVSKFGRETVAGGFVALSKAGVKRVVLALEDTRFICVHSNPSDTQDLLIIEAEQIDSVMDEPEMQAHLFFERK